MKKTSVFVIDDHSVARMGMSAIISLYKDLRMVGDSEGGMAAVRRVVELRPDVVVCDLMMPGMNGAETTAAILKELPEAKVLILTTFGTAKELSDAMAAGAAGAVTKDLSNDELARAIREVAAGARWVSPGIARTLEGVGVVPGMTERHRQLLDGVAKGLSNDQLAEQVGLSRGRVKQLLAEIYTMLGANNRAEAVALAMKLGR